MVYPIQECSWFVSVLGISSKWTDPVGFVQYANWNDGPAKDNRGRFGLVGLFGAVGLTYGFGPMSFLNFLPMF